MIRITMDCCSKLICNGCNFANIHVKREKEAGLEMRCTFCREPMPKSQEEVTMRCEKRIKKNDPSAMRFRGRNCIDEGDYESALKYFTKASKLGNVEAHYNLSVMHRDGIGVEEDEEKAIYHLEEAAIAGQKMEGSREQGHFSSSPPISDT